MIINHLLLPIRQNLLHQSAYLDTNIQVLDYDGIRAGSQLLFSEYYMQSMIGKIRQSLGLWRIYFGCIILHEIQRIPGFGTRPEEFTLHLEPAPRLWEAPLKTGPLAAIS